MKYAETNMTFGSDPQNPKQPNGVGIFVTTEYNKYVINYTDNQTEQYY